MTLANDSVLHGQFFIVPQPSNPPFAPYFDALPVRIAGLPIAVPSIVTLSDPRIGF